ncbi:hypothetical protein FACS1894217_00610 [Clostridia bacterium]|nr:hypothetical protein FACS1894217_00610 [Clostridia bacterium]
MKNKLFAINIVLLIIAVGALALSGSLFTPDVSHGAEFAPMSDGPLAATEVDVTSVWGEGIAPQAFVTELQAKTSVYISYLTQPDFRLLGPQPVSVVVRDRKNHEIVVHSKLFVLSGTLSATVDGGEVNVSDFVPDAQGHNVSIKDTLPSPLPSGVLSLTLLLDGRECPVTLTVKGTATPTSTSTPMPSSTPSPSPSPSEDPDTEAPVITGAKDLSIMKGDKVQYRSGVTVTDNRDESVELMVDSSAVNTAAEGKYTVVYSATDAAGNKAEVKITVTVGVTNEDTVYELADNVITSLNLTGLDTKQKLIKIRTWVINNVVYENHGDKDSVISGAYNAFKLKKGDCYTFYAVSEVLLTRAGIENMEIERVPDRPSKHYWNLVKVDGKWYHYDATPHKKPIDTYMFTDADIASYVQLGLRSNYYYEYKASLYPEVQ